MVLLVLIVTMMGAAAALFVAMCRRDDSMLGLVGLTVAMVAAVVAVAYGGIESL
jgi:hypothetical protein